MSSLSRHLTFLIGGLAVAALALPAHAQFGTNLIVNPDAEAGAGSDDGSGVLVPVGPVSEASLPCSTARPVGFPLPRTPVPRIAVVTSLQVDPTLPSPAVHRSLMFRQAQRR